MANSRKTLVALLLKIENSGYSNLVLNAVLAQSELSVQDKNFVTAAFYGVVEQKRLIDYILNLYLKRPIEKAAPYTAAVLRSGAYQILFMSKVPHSAAVNESVNLVRQSRERGNAGLVNAVLRKVCSADLEKMKQTCPPAVRFSVADWLYSALSEDFGREKAEAFLEHSLLPPEVYIKLNPIAQPPEVTAAQLTESGVDLTAMPLPQCFRATGLKNAENLTDSRFFVQEYASQLCVAALNAKAGDRVLDVCAAPGGKTFCAAIAMENKGEILSCELHQKRADLVKKGAERLKLSCVHAIAQDSTVFQSEFGQFDKIICDVPCSGFGVISRKPEIKYKKEQDCARLPQIQLKILENAAKYLKSGGRMIYSTCTVLKRENQEVVERFLQNNKNFKAVPLFHGQPQTEQTLLPPQDGSDGFYMAAIERM